MKNLSDIFWVCAQPEGNIFKGIRIIVSKKHAYLIGVLYDDMMDKPWANGMDWSVKDWEMKL